MIKKFNKYDVIIYGCLFAAILCLVLGGQDYLKSLKMKATIKPFEAIYMSNQL